MRSPRTKVRWGVFLKTLFQRWDQDDLGDVAGAVTFSAVLSLFPFLLFLVEFGSRFIDPETEARIVEHLSKVAPAPVTDLIASRIRSLAVHKSSGLALFAIIGAIWSVSSGFATLVNALNTCYSVHETRPFWKLRLGSILLTFFTVPFSVAASAVLLGLPVLTSKLGEAGRLLLWLRFPAAAVVTMVLWAALYWLLPNVKSHFRLFTPGSVIGVLLWLFASWLFSVYIAHFNGYDVTYGVLGGVAILLLWMWISAQAFLLGAEINSTLAVEEKAAREGSVRTVEKQPIRRRPTRPSYT